MIYTQRAHGWTQFVSMQNHYNLVYREEEREMIPFCLEEGIGVIPWSPLARGFLAGNRKRGEKTRVAARAARRLRPQPLLRRRRLRRRRSRRRSRGERKGVLPIQVALAWILSKPGVTAPIVSATKLEQLDSAESMAMSVTRSPEEIAFCRAVSAASGAATVEGEACSQSPVLTNLRPDPCDVETIRRAAQ